MIITKLKFSILVFLTCLFPLTYALAMPNIGEDNPVQYDLVISTEMMADKSNSELLCERQFNVFVDCTITIKADGVELQVTFHDISWFRCTTLKIGKWLKDVF